jgi:hypothetical protein
VQACHTAREILTVILDRFADPSAVKRTGWWTPVAETGDGVSKRQKLRFLVACDGVIDAPLLDELDLQVDRALDTHRKAIGLAHPKTPASYDAAKAAIIDLEEVMLTLLRFRSTLGH